MTIELNHTIVWTNDKAESAGFLARILGRHKPQPFGHFLVVELDNGVSLDFMEKKGEVALLHYAFLIDESNFDVVFARIEAAGLDYWADPARTRAGEINHNDGGRGVYFAGPEGHLLELITKPYGAEEEIKN